MYQLSVWVMMHKHISTQTHKYIVEENYECDGDEMGWMMVTVKSKITIKVVQDEDGNEC